MKQIVITTQNNQITAAVLEEERLVEVLDDTERESRHSGSIFKGRVINIVPGIQAAFVDIGLGKNAFLYAADVIQPIYEHEQKILPCKVPAIGNLLNEGQEVIVQIMREAVGEKGAKVTTNLSIPGRYTVLLLGNKYHLGISRKITDEKERQRLFEWGQKVKPHDTGMIIRTLAEDVPEEELLDDIQKLISLKEEIKQKIEGNGKGLLYSSNDPLSRLLREVIDEGVERIIVDDSNLAEQLRAQLKQINCAVAHRVWTDLQGNLFERYGLENQIRYATLPKVELINGGYLIIQHTEALTVIDVNSGKYIGERSLQDTLLTLNLEAASEVSKQIKLRNLSGIIIVDFIDLEKKEDGEKVLAQLETSFQKDKIKCRVLGLTQLGLVEITRKKEGQTLAARYTTKCPQCDGKGRLPKSFLKVIDEHV